ncbi:hypothetical protein JKP88DRAFT_319293 [Tribonema minus]|uniref:Uncharacterized protein n=1 Tax=Tribonema minus TaxID=303371 RepID=A0A835YVL6_9STRA|nr:hypothetical protein JKP88DRAFT_319293 [Tribonema minus]
MWELDPFAVLGPAGVIQLLINEFLYDTKPSYTVNSASDLHQALKDCNFGDCNLLTADVNVETHLQVDGCRLQGAHVGASNARRPSITTHRGPLLVANAMVEGLNLTTGDEEQFNPDNCFPGVEASGTCGALLRRCCITSYQGTTLMACCCGIVAEDCGVSSNGCFLGAVVRDDDGPSSGPGFLSMRGCAVEDNAWGAFLGKDTPAGVKRAMLAANTFRRNSHEDITEIYSYTGQRVQPWRRGWDSAKP